ncbi:hypothetical protein HF521_021300 [Silurus meridionalis]|uniref:Uncharacterized protein n=1 Tax=Silurus meridionalis TaxID=175797 RepID=A0A8T0BAS6_SILME|nr:hypothetical protein HF521_021300 [Silurus meridionalis]
MIEPDQVPSVDLPFETPFPYRFLEPSGSYLPIWPIVSQAASKADIDSLKSELLSSLRSEIIEVFKAELRALERTLGNDLLTIKSELQAVKAQLSSNKAENEAAVRELKGTVAEMERSLSVCTDDIAVMQRDIHRLTAEYNKLETKCEDLEARSRRNNVRIIGVPEGPNSSTTAVLPCC